MFAGTEPGLRSPRMMRHREGRISAMANGSDTVRIRPATESSTKATKQAVPPESPYLGAEELKFLNNASLEFLRSLPTEELVNRVDAVSVETIEDEEGLKIASELLDKEGIVIVKNFLDQEQLAAADEAIAKVSLALEQATEDQNYEDDELIVQSAVRVADSFRAMAEHPKSIATIRRGADAGMVDVFNIDRLVPNRREALRAPFTGSGLLSLIGESDDRPQAANLNLYVNRGITGTRGFHADSFGKSLKGFVYLTDVVSIDQGPYCFVRRTHKDGPWRRANMKISELAKSKTESPFIDISMATPVLAPRGSLILSDQAGIHRGIPQIPDAIRRVLVMRYL